MSEKFRTESDSMGNIQVPVDALYAAQTQRAVNNFHISGKRMPRAFIHALSLIKACCALANKKLGLLDAPIADAIVHAAREVADGKHDAHFPIDVFQTGSGTSSNMNANEVIATLASRASGLAIHPNDHVNAGQSSNDVIPTAVHVSASLELSAKLVPALRALIAELNEKSVAFTDFAKTGRTHLMDAMPVTFGQELGAWSTQIKNAVHRLSDTSIRLNELAQGGTAVGSGVNAHPDFPEVFCDEISRETNIPFRPKPDKFEALSCQDAAVETSGQLRVLAVSLMKISNDLRWMNSGPLAGLGEISLVALQPGSSIMPGKVNPVIPEAVSMVCAQVFGNDLCITVSGQSGNFQLNVMLPVIALNLLETIDLLSNACTALTEKVFAGFTVNQEKVAEPLAKNPILVTALNSVIGYEKGAAIAKKAYREGRPILDVAEENTDIPRARLEELLDPLKLTSNKQKNT